MSTTLSTLKQWASSSKLQDVTLSDDGKSLTLDNTTLVGDEQVTVEHNGKSCQYTVASIFLQIRDPNQGLRDYRSACKKHGITDSVKAVDKATVVDFFLGSADVAAVPTEDSKKPAPAEEAADKKHRSSSKKDDHRHRKDSKEKDHHRKRREDDKQQKSPQKAKKAKKLVTNEQLFSNLSVVVDKRQMDKKAQEEITKALSAEGFAVTNEMLEEESKKEVLQTIFANEIPVGNSASILRAANPRKNLSRVLELYMETILPAKASSSSSKSKPSSKLAAAAVVSNKASLQKQKPKKSYLIGKKPVIIVPKGMTAPLTLINAHEFFCHGKFVPRDVMIKQGRQRSPATTFTRNVRGRGGGGASASGGSGGQAGAGSSSGLLEYEIMDNPKRLGTDTKEWERIVAVIVLGQSWQFKDWPPPYNNPVQLFSKTLGFYVGMEGAKLPDELSGWAVKKAKLNRDKRGLDSVTYASFWNSLDEFMSVHRPELLPQQES